ncbi:ABC transporter substrate-binding protein [Amycolatopsis sp. CA-230715]|uniref:ABC transporter substrate-binding protein n=1 Tax=Amycolatopsis sp. CA-230715 TaxID=2745196 RepID=UPI001C0185CF|nr:ABC transporter substrate-binding protein [Amycolatopsis sp. CA-230715]QWF84946.1 Oligopeptide-binding protein AppA [Amycolatopsis sp. CA-230715]
MARRFASAALAAAALALSACTGPAGGGAAGTVTVYLYQEPVGLFGPLAPASGPDVQVMSMIDEGLLAIDPNYDLKPVLASDYRISADAKTLTFTLRKNLKWSDGAPFTSADVLFTYQRMADRKSGSATAGNYRNVAGFSAPDPSTFVIEAKTPDVGLAALIGTVYIMPKHVLGDVPVEALAKHPFFRKPVVGMGPYRFADYQSSQYVHVTRNDNYRSPVSITDIYLKPMASDVATAQLGNGGIDIASYSPTDQDTVAGLGTVDTQQVQGAGFVRIALNQTKPYFSDVRVRQAFLYALDRKELVDKVLFGKAAVQNSDFAVKNAPPGLNEYAYDPAKARQLLEAAGWDPNRTVVLQWVPGQRDRDATATIVQNQLKAVGVSVQLKQVQPTQITPSLNDKSYDMLLYGGGNYAADSSSVHAITACSLRYPTGANQNFFCDAKLDEVMVRANATTDQAKRKALYDQAARIENDAADLMWLYSPYGLWAVNKRIENFQAPGSQEFPFWAPGTWKVQR